MHTDDADVENGWTLNDTDMRPGVSVKDCDEGLWRWEDREKSITYRELKEVRMILMERLVREVVTKKYSNLLLHVKNQAVVHI